MVGETKSLDTAEENDPCLDIAPQSRFEGSRIPFSREDILTEREIDLSTSSKTQIIQYKSY